MVVRQIKVGEIFGIGRMVDTNKPCECFVTTANYYEYPNQGPFFSCNVHDAIIPEVGMEIIQQIRPK